MHYSKMNNKNHNLYIINLIVLDNRIIIIIIIINAL